MINSDIKDTFKGPCGACRQCIAEVTLDIYILNLPSAI